MLTCRSLLDWVKFTFHNHFHTHKAANHVNELRVHLRGQLGLNKLHKVRVESYITAIKVHLSRVSNQIKTEKHVVQYYVQIKHSVVG